MACLGNKFTAIDDPNNIEGFVQCVEIRIVELKKATSKRERKKFDDILDASDFVLLFVSNH